MWPAHGKWHLRTKSFVNSATVLWNSHNTDGTRRGGSVAVEICCSARGRGFDSLSRHPHFDRGRGGCETLAHLDLIRHLLNSRMRRKLVRNFPLSFATYVHSGVHHCGEMTSKLKFLQYKAYFQARQLLWDGKSRNLFLRRLRHLARTNNCDNLMHWLRREKHTQARTLYRVSAAVAGHGYLESLKVITRKQ